MIEETYQELIAVYYLKDNRFEFHVVPAHESSKSTSNFSVPKDQCIIVWSVTFKKDEYLIACLELWLKVRESFVKIIDELGSTLSKKYLNKEDKKVFKTFIHNFRSEKK